MGAIQSTLQYANLITHLAGASNYCWFHFQTGEKQLLSKPISHYERQLPGFLRTHRTVLVNPAHVKCLHAPPHPKKAGEIQLLDGQRLPVSRRRWPLVAQELANYIATRLDSTTADRLLIGHSVTNHTPGTDSRCCLLLVSDQPGSVEAVTVLMAHQWPTHSSWSTAQGRDLPELLMALPQRYVPALILLDARTKTQERMDTLRRLKQEPALRSLPIILMVPPVDKLVVAGYALQANSVLCLPEDKDQLSSRIKRVCRFWLDFAALPLNPLHE